MRASELIQRLTELMNEHGDLPVTKNDVYGKDHKIGPVCAYDKKGGDTGQRVEIYIH